MGKSKASEKQASAKRSAPVKRGTKNARTLARGIQAHLEQDKRSRASVWSDRQNRVHTLLHECFELTRRAMIFLDPKASIEDTYPTLTSAARAIAGRGPRRTAAPDEAPIDGAPVQARRPRPCPDRTPDDSNSRVRRGASCAVASLR